MAAYERRSLGIGPHWPFEVCNTITEAITSGGIDGHQSGRNELLWPTPQT
ncbi:hypothetical protein [Microlunatus phosphovorus]|nr:hypothetical protein [Microlunatus phosphovorus]